MTYPLIDVGELADRLEDAKVRIIDCRFDLADPEAGRRHYRAGHIPGAVYAHLDHDLSAPDGPGRHPLPEPAAFAGWLGAMGIGNDSEVIAYDGSGSAFASRVWWMLRSLGHSDVRVLDGGWPAWDQADLPVEAGWPEIVSTTHAAPVTWQGVVDRNDVRNGLGRLMLIDARAPARFAGEFEPIDPIGGHIPTARNIPFGDNIGAAGLWRDPAELAERFADLDGTIVNYCGSGVTACHNILAMELAGITDVLLYPGSWSDWSTAGEAVATGADD